MQNTSYSELATWLHEVEHRNLIQTLPWPVLVATVDSIVDSTIEWAESCAFVPIILITSGLLLVLAYYIFICCKRKWSCCKSLAINKDKPNVCYIVSLAIMCGLTLAAIGYFLVYQVYTRQDATHMLDIVDDVDAYRQSIVTDVTGVRDATGREVVLIEYIVTNSSGVNMTQDMRDRLDETLDIATSAHEFLIDAADTIDIDIALDTVHDYTDTGLYWHLIGISVTGSVALVLLVITLAITFAPSQPIIPCQYCVDISAVGYFGITWIVACVLFAVSIAMGDVCHIAPTAFVKSQIDSDVMLYYWDCVPASENPVDGNIDSAYDLLVEAQGTIQEFIELSRNYTDLYNAAVYTDSNITLTLQLLNSTKEHVQCDTIHEQVVEVTDLVCVDLLPHLFFTFIGLGAAGFLLPVTFCLMARRTIHGAAAGGSEHRSLIKKKNKKKKRRESGIELLQPRVSITRQN